MVSVAIRPTLYRALCASALLGVGLNSMPLSADGLVKEFAAAASAITSKAESADPFACVILAAMPKTDEQSQAKFDALVEKYRVASASQLAPTQPGSPREYDNVRLRVSRQDKTDPSLQEGGNGSGGGDGSNGYFTPEMLLSKGGALIWKMESAPGKGHTTYANPAIGKYIHPSAVNFELAIHAPSLARAYEILMADKIGDVFDFVTIVSVKSVR